MKKVSFAITRFVLLTVLLTVACMSGCGAVGDGAALSYLGAEKSQAAPGKTDKAPSVGEGAESQVLILMYHQLLNTQYSQYIVKPNTLRNDLRALKRHGYQSIRTSQLVDFVDQRGMLPAKPVLITFDDGHYNNLYYGESILKEEGFTAVESIVGKFSETSTDTGTGSIPNYSHLTWEEIKGMAERGVFEIGNHTYDMHKFSPRFGIGQKKGESDERFCNVLSADVQTLQGILAEKSNVTPTVFAFPFGKYNQISKQVLDNLGFRVMLTCNEGVSTVRAGDKKSLWQLMRYNRNPEYNIETFLNARDKAFAK